MGGRLCSTVPAVKLKSSKKFSRSLANFTKALSKSKSERPDFVGSSVPLLGTARTVMLLLLLCVPPLVSFSVSKFIIVCVLLRLSDMRERRLFELVRLCLAAAPRGAALPSIGSEDSSSEPSAIVLPSTGGSELPFVVVVVGGR